MLCSFITPFSPYNLFKEAVVYRLNIKPLLLGVLVSIFFGCSGGADNSVMPDIPGDSSPQLPSELGADTDGQSSRVLWGIWNLHFDPATNQVEITTVRAGDFHANVTDMLLPPNCDDCLGIAVTAFDPITRILSADVTVRNPTPLTGWDVRGILLTNDYGHKMMNADDWTGLWDVPGGGTLNPFGTFATDWDTREFAGLGESTEPFEVYIPIPPAYFAITFAVDASWPGHCKDPWKIDDFTQVDDLYDFVGATATVTVGVYDWQDDVSKVTLVAPEITGQSFTAFTFESGNTWTVELVNNMGVPSGDYEVRIIADSTNSPGTPLYDYVDVSVYYIEKPTVSEINPDAGYSGNVYADVIVYGDGFEGPGMQVTLKMDGEPDIPGTNVENTSTTVAFDLDIPMDATLGVYDVEVLNGTGAPGIGEDLFEVTALTPEVLSIDPVHWEAGDVVPGAIITGNNFQGPGIEVALKMDGEPDIPAIIFAWELTSITCDIPIPGGAALGFYDVEVTNGNGMSGVGEDMFDVHGNAPDFPLDITPDWLNFSPYDVIHDGSQAFSSAGANGFHIWNVSDYLNPVWGNKVDPNPDFPGKRVICKAIGKDETLYMWVALEVQPKEDIASDYYLMTVNVDDIGMEFIEGYYQTTNEINDIDADLYTIYLATGNQVLIVDGSNPESMTLLKTVDLQSNYSAGSIHYDNGYVFVTVGQDGFEIVDVDPPAEASSVKAIDTTDWAMDIDVENGYAYVANDYDGVRVYDIDPVASAYEVAHVPTTPASAKSIDAHSYYAAVTCGVDGIRVLDIEPPDLANEVVSLSVDNWAGKVSWYYKSALVADHDLGFYLVDMINPATATIADVILTPNPDNLTLHNGTLFSSAWKAGVMAIDVSTPSAPSIVSRFDTVGMAREMVTSGGYGYFIEVFGAGPEYELNLVDIDPVESMSIYNTQTMGESGDQVGVYGDYVYFGTGGVNNLWIYDINPPESIEFVKTVATSNSIRDLYAFEGYTHVAAGTYLDIVDTDPIFDASVIKSVDTGYNLLKMAGTGSHAYVLTSTWPRRLLTIDTFPPGEAVVEGEIELAGSSWNVAAQGQYAYVTGAGDAEGLVVIDVDPADSPYIVTNYEKIGQYECGDIAVDGVYAYVAYDGGIRIIQFQ